MAQLINYQMKVTIQDTRVIVGMLLLPTLGSRASLLSTLLYLSSHLYLVLPPLFLLPQSSPAFSSSTFTLLLLLLSSVSLTFLQNAPYCVSFDRLSDFDL